MAAIRDWLEWVSLGIETLGVAILVLGIALALATAGTRLASGHARVETWESLRKSMGRAILLGLEVLIAADLVHTVVVDRTLEAVLGLALIVFVRTLLSFSLQIEIDGTLPWRKGT